MPSRRLRPRAVDGPGPKGQDLLRRQGLATIDPGQKGAHVGAVEGGGVHQGASNAWARSCQWEPSDRSALEPVAVDPTSTRHRAIESAPVHVPHDCRGDQWRGTHPRSGIHRPGRIEEETPPESGAGAKGGVEHVRFGRCGHHRTIAGQHVGDDQCRRFSRAGRTEDHDRMLRTGEAPTALTVPEIRPVVRARRCGQHGAMRELTRWRGFCEKYFVNEFPSRHHLVRCSEPRRTRGAAMTACCLP